MRLVALAVIHVIIFLDSKNNTLFSYSWPGTKEGCNCLDKYNLTGYADYENKLLYGSCSIVLLDLGCYTILGIPSKELLFLGQQMFCSERSNFNTVFSYFLNYSTNVFEAGSNCAKEMKSCGLIDSLNNILCVSEDTPCPISQWNNSISQIYYDQSIIQNEELILNKIRYFSNFFIEFRFSQGEVCINNEELNFLTKDIYELFQNKKILKCATTVSDYIKYDNRYTPLMNIPTGFFFQSEKFLKDNIENLPNFPFDYFSLPLTLYGRNYIGWNKKCQHLMHSFIKMYEVCVKIQNYSIFYLVYSLVVLIYCMLFIMIFKELLYEQFKLKIAIIMVHALLILIIFVMVLDDYIGILNSIGLIFTVLKKRCSDTETNRLMVYILQLLEQISKLFLVTIILYVIMLVLSFFKIILTIYKLYKDYILQRVMRGGVNEFEMILLM
jgi:hypothetical protein